VVFSLDHTLNGRCFIHHFYAFTNHNFSSGRYKLPLVIAGTSGILCFTLLLSTWRGHTPVWQAFFVFFGGFATGITQSAVFVDLAAGVEDSEIAIASSGLYLCGNIGMLAGISSASSIFGTALRNSLADVLRDVSNADEVSHPMTLSLSH